MIDMRGEEDAILQPHSQMRHELMHNQYNRMKEEEHHWQDVSVSDFNFLSLFPVIVVPEGQRLHAPAGCCTERDFVVPQFNI